MKKHLPIALIIILFACEKSVHALFYSAENKSPVEIKVSPTQWRSDELIINPEQYLERQIYDARGRQSFDGKASGFDLDGSPVTITFDNSYSVTHYNDSLTHEGKYLNKSSKRCIYNPESYTIKKFGGSSYISEIAQYVFTEDDYNFARQ